MAIVRFSVKVTVLVRFLFDNSFCDYYILIMNRVLEAILLMPH